MKNYETIWEIFNKCPNNQMRDVFIDEVTPLQRRNAKAVNFGIVYGISSFGLSQDLSISRKEASEYIEKYFETYPGIKNFLDGLVEHAKEKLTRKHVDMIAANNVKVAGAGFGTDTNVVTLITEDGVEELAKMSKEEVASRIVDALLRIRGNRE